MARRLPALWRHPRHHKTRTSRDWCAKSHACQTDSPVKWCDSAHLIGSAQTRKLSADMESLSLVRTILGGNCFHGRFARAGVLAPGDLPPTVGVTGSAPRGCTVGAHAPWSAPPPNAFWYAFAVSLVAVVVEGPPGRYVYRPSAFAALTATSLPGSSSPVFIPSLHA